MRGVGHANAAEPRLAARLVASVVSASTVAVALYVLLFGQVPNISPDVLPRETALRQAAREAGRIWPGTRVEFHRDGPDRIRIDRRWLGLVESRGFIHREAGGWILGSSPAYGPGETVQVVLGLVLPTALTLFGVLIMTRPKT